MQKFDFTAPASGASQTINAPGRYLKYVTGNAGGNDAGLIITPGSKPGSKILLYPGQAITLPEDGAAGPNAWTISNAVGQAQITGSIVIGNGRLDDNTLQGTVQVVDGAKSRVLAGIAFCVAAQSQVPAAGAYARMQLWNPATSGKRLVVESISLMVNGTATQANVVGTNVALANAAVQQPQNKNLGIVGGSVVQMTTDVTQTTTTSVQSPLFQLDAASNSTFPFVPKEPIVVPPGFGLMAGSLNAATALLIGFEWFEEPNV